MTYNSVLASGILALLAVAASSLFVRFASAHEQEAHLRETSAHLNARVRRLSSLGRDLEARSLIVESRSAGDRTGAPGLRLRYAALAALVAVWSTSSGQAPRDPGPHDAAPAATAPSATRAPAKAGCTRSIIAARYVPLDTCPEGHRRLIS